MHKRTALVVLFLLLAMRNGVAWGQVFGVELQNNLMPASGGMAGTSISRPQDLLSAINANPATEILCTSLVEADLHRPSFCEPLPGVVHPAHRILSGCTPTLQEPSTARPPRCQSRRVYSSASPWLSNPDSSQYGRARRLAAARRVR